MRRLLQSAILASATLMAGPLTPDASAGHEMKLGKVRVGLGVTVGGVRVSIGGRRAPQVHHHNWTFSTRREWVPPRYRMAVVGYDSCGRRIRREVMVRAGYWKYVRVRQCCCGSSLDY